MSIRGLILSYFMQIVLIFILAGIARSNVITIVIPAEEVTCSLNSEVFGNAVLVDGVPSISRIGSPSLPEVPMKVALPAGCRAVSLEILSISYSSIGEVEFIAPVSRQVPTSGEWPFKPAIADPDVYELDNFYPEQPVLLSGSGVIWGIPIATLQLHPARWNPVSGELEYLESLTLSIETEFSMEVSTISRRTLESETQSIEVVKKDIMR